jgi:tetratricopeptide (TPR) repeat protein
MNDWLEAEQRVERAQQLSESHRWAEALTELDAALAIHPTNALWHAQRGYLLEELDRTEEAADAYQRSFDLDPDDREVALALGATLARLGRMGAALQVFESLAREHPDFEPAYCHRVYIYAELGRHDQAEEMFYLAQQLDDACPDCFFHLGSSLAARGQHDRAIFCWERVLELEPAYIGVNRRIAQAHRAKGNRDEAHEYFLRELRDDPGNVDLLFELADLALESGQIAAASAKLEQILELEPRHAGARLALGRVWLRTGHPDKALACFDSLQANSDPEMEYDKAEADTLAGEALCQLGRFAEARVHLEAAVERGTDGGRVMMLLGDSLLAVGKAPEAADRYRRVLAVDAHNPFAHHRLGVCLLKSGRAAAALEHCLYAVRGNPRFGGAMFSAAMAHIQLGHWRAAREMLGRAAGVLEDDGPVRRIRKRLWRYQLRYYLDRLRGRSGRHP